MEGQTERARCRKAGRLSRDKKFTLPVQLSEKRRCRQMEKGIIRTKNTNSTAGGKGSRHGRSLLLKEKRGLYDEKGVD